MKQTIDKAFGKSVRIIAFIMLLSAGSFFSVSASASVIPTDWETQTSGTIGGVTVTLSSIDTPFGGLVTWFDLSSSYFSAAPLPSGTELVEYSSNSNWTVTFSEPIQDPLLYVGWWRGAHNDIPDPPTQYTFDQSFQVLSGLQDSTVSGTILTLPDSGGSDIQNFHSGIIQFTGSITSISVVTDAIGGGGQLMTFASPVPVPAAVWLFGSGLLGLVGVARRKRS